MKTMKKSIFVLTLILFLIFNNSCSNPSSDSLVIDKFASYNESGDSYIPCIPRNLNTGDSVLFGHYEQDGDAANGKEQIKWIILHKDSSDKYLIAAEKS